MTTAVQDPRTIQESALRAATTPAEKLRVLLNYAILAPSGDNSQPWHFQIADNTVTLLADRSRARPVIDPQGRELVISCGAALFYLRVAIRYFGYNVTVQPFPVADNPDLLAHVVLGRRWPATMEEQLLFRGMPYRRTNRGPYQEWRVPESVLMALEAAAAAEGAWLQIVRPDTQRAALADLIREADRVQWANPAFRDELAGWLDPQHTAAHDGMPSGDRLEPHVVRTFDMGRSLAAADHSLATSAPALAVLGTLGDQPADWLRTGQALARLLLRASAEGVESSFFNQPVEVPAVREQVRTLLERDGPPQMIIRLGYGPTVEASARRPVAEVLG